MASLNISAVGFYSAVKDNAAESRGERRVLTVTPGIPEEESFSSEGRFPLRPRYLIVDVGL